MIVLAQTPGQRQLLVEYLANRLQTTIPDLIGNLSYDVALVMRQGAMRGAVLYTDYRGIDVEMKVAGEPGFITRRAVRESVGYAFAVLGVRRLTANVHRRNKAARQLCERVGFKFEGVKRQAAPKGGDIVLYGMTEKEWRNGPVFKA